MNKEIERKYLVKNSNWKGKVEPVLYRQGYIARTMERVVRVRIAGDVGTITIKFRTGQISRDEFEYTIPLEEAHLLLDNLDPREILEKYRYTFEELGHIWEVDEFTGVNKGLVVAEVELESEEEKVNLPNWVGKEVSKISQYLNVALCDKPYVQWQKQDKEQNS